MNEQLLDVVITVGMIEYNNDGLPYATSKVFRLDVEGDPDAFLAYVNSSRQVVHTETLKAAAE